MPNILGLSSGVGALSPACLHFTQKGPMQAWPVSSRSVGVEIGGPGNDNISIGGAVTVSGSTTVNTVLVTTATYTALVTDGYIGVDRVGTVTITLPTGTDGKEYIVKDERGGSDVNSAITIQGTAQHIDGAVTATITQIRGSLTFLFRGTEWHII